MLKKNVKVCIKNVKECKILVKNTKKRRSIKEMIIHQKKS